MLTFSSAAAACNLRPPLPLALSPRSFARPRTSPARFPPFSTRVAAPPRRRFPLRAAGADSTVDPGEVVFFDGGAHYGDLVSNLFLGITLLWLPLTLAAAFRAFFLRYRFTSRRVTVISGLTGGDRTDFPYSSVADVKAVPRFIGEWGDIVIELKDGTKVDLRSVPRFREVADYCKKMAAGDDGSDAKQRRRGF